MRRSKGSLLRTATAMMAAFLLQTTAAGFCLNEATAEPMPVPQMVESHCNEAMAGTQASPMGDMHHHSSTDSSGACAHCDTPDLWASAGNSIDLTPYLLVMPAVVSNGSVQHVATVQVDIPPILAPPTSHTLLYRYTQRLRI